MGLLCNRAMETRSAGAGDRMALALVTSKVGNTERSRIGMDSTQHKSKNEQQSKDRERKTEKKRREKGS